MFGIVMDTISLKSYGFPIHVCIDGLVLVFLCSISMDSLVFPFQ